MLCDTMITKVVLLPVPKSWSTPSLVKGWKTKLLHNIATLHTQQQVEHTFRGGECITGAGGEGGPRGILVFVLEKNKKKHRNQATFMRLKLKRSWQSKTNSIQQRERETSQIYKNSKTKTGGYSLEFWWLHRIRLLLHHTNDTLLGTTGVGSPLLSRSISTLIQQREQW